MKLMRFLLLMCGAAVISTSAAAADPPPGVTGDDLLKAVRMSQALQDLHKLKGHLRNDTTGQQYNMELTMSTGVMRFLLRNPNEIINLDLNNNGTKLTRVTAGGKIEMPMSLYSEHVRGTDINYEDLSMRFLYWPHAKIIGEETLSFQKCFIVRVTNPDGRGPYGTVDVWVAKNNGAMMKMEAHNAKGQKVKQFLVRKGQKYKGAYILKQMRVESFNPDKPGEVVGRTYMDIDDPD